MSSEALYEQYKDALKRGHVAALRGHVDEALVAYADAARIAPERSTPHSSAGTALLRRKRPGDALRHYDVALQVSPRDEAALLGRAQCLALINRRGDAADAFDALAEVQASNGRLADAVDAARRGLEMAEGRERRRTLERLIAKLRASEPGEPGRLALERALQVLDGVAVPHAESGVAANAPKAGAKPVAAAAEPKASAAAEPAAEPASAAKPAPEPIPWPEADLKSKPKASTSKAAAASSPVVPSPTKASRAASDEAVAASAASADEVSVDAAEPAAAEASASADGAALATAFAPVEPPVEAPAEPEPEPEAEPSPEPEPEAEPEPVEVSSPTSRALPEGATLAELAAKAEAAVEARVPEPAVEALLDLAALHARDGRIDAALDACYSAVTFDADNIALHLALAELYAERGWTSLVSEKLSLLHRLGELDGDGETLADVAAVRAALS
jgi:tetratricopeptide (TPR) repeat protein